MTLRALVTGTLIRKPEVKTSASGKTFAKGMLRIELSQRTESDPDSALLFLIAFGGEADALAAMVPGDSVAVAGKLTVTAGMYQDKPQATLNVLADRLIDGKRPPRLQRSETVAAAERAFCKDDAGDVASMADDVPF